MIISIRRFLIFYLLLILVLATIVTAFGNYYLDKKDIKRHSDLILSHAGLSMNALIDKDVNQLDIDRLQENFNQIPQHAKRILGEKQPEFSSALSNKFQFQIWDHNNQLVLSSLNAPHIPFATNQIEGLSTRLVDKNFWRIFSHYNPETKLRIEIAEPITKRNQLSHRIAIDDIYMMLITFPLTGLFIWFIIGYSFKGVREIADEVSHRVPNFLEPVDTKKVPEEIKPLTNELNKLFGRLRRAFEREKRFAGDAAHELKTPLAALKTQAQVAMKMQDKQQIEQQLKNIINSVDRCSHIVQQLLILSRLVPEVETLQDIVSIDLNKLTAEVIAEQAIFAIEKDIEIELIPSQTKKANIKGNVTAISILIRNLVDNAIRYTPKLGSVKVKIIVNPMNVKLKVTDNGPGIAPKLRKRVLERFYRVLGSEQRGSGLGLAIVMQIVELHNAAINLNTPISGKGLEVEILFPR
ncbi:MAG: ATP-binding protein [Pseudomonadota bacterium]